MSKNHLRINGDFKLVYCINCGTFNADKVTNCSDCSAPLFSKENIRFSRQQRQRYEYGYQSRRSGGGLGLLIVGLFIIIIGIIVLTDFTLFWRYFWPIVLVLIGIWIIVIGLRRNRRYRVAPPQ
jgi:divalent metal cation (Fe/Co/Zn/Cd) transporter